ncbi:ubiquitinyl hydrolase 1 [Dictyocaulus viviparus]|uniref:Ubiquitin carboxyl-terminal hydrolase n=1 Tax=Dictyocaulus viviparus TaxID=29172 RepID=A0A0D8Y0L8_DICVI|nr:ubiquitinyl hydrolase 1 [Dictyocaulus viviparus]
MVVISDPWASSNSTKEKEESPSPPGVQFNSVNCGLPGGDMQLGRACAPDIDSGMESANTSTNEDHLDVSISNTDLESAHSDLSATIPLDENGHKYVGLINQAMTCYLNSLVQSLYMTPEFRNAIYRWEYRSDGKFGNTGEREARSIPYQIQKLFLLLQTSDLGSLETRDLTASFGWSNNEAYDQHDVQELCRLMFDALELKWRGTQNEKLIQNLYRGKMQDFVKCFKCGRENVRADVFLDLPLAVKPFGAVEAFRSVEEALHAFISPELLEGSNQYFCENCNSKQDAHKGLRITEFPYLLTIQLKRFDFDYNTMHRIKLNDRMTFPDVLDLNPFVYSPHGSNVDTCQKEQFSSALDSELMPSNQNENCSEIVVAGQQLDRAIVNQLLKRGEYVYELFSVMVHQGSAAGGHYFAHIKYVFSNVREPFDNCCCSVNHVQPYFRNMDQGRWFCFNDTRVEPVGPEEISKSFGGSCGGWSTSNTNAYMLMYRKISKLNATFIRTPDLPRHITELKTHWKEQEAEREKQRIYLLNLVNITVQLNMVCDNEAMLNEHYVVDLPRSEVLWDVYNQSLKFFEDRSRLLHSSNDNFRISSHNSRLIHVTSNRGLSINEAYVSKADLAKKLDFFLGSGRPSNLIFLLDVWRHRGIPYPVSPPNGRTIRVARVDITEYFIHPSFYIYVNPLLHTVIQVKQLIGSMFGDGQRAVVASRLILERDSQTNELLSLDSPLANFNELLQQCFSRVPLIYCDCGSNGNSLIAVEEDRKKPLNESIMFAVLDRKKFAQFILVELPPQEDITRAQVANNVHLEAFWTKSEGIQDSVEGSASSPAVHCPITSDGMSRSSSQGSNVTTNANTSEMNDDYRQKTPQVVVCFSTLQMTLY